MFDFWMMVLVKLKAILLCTEEDAHTRLSAVRLLGRGDMDRTACLQVVDDGYVYDIE